MAHSLFISYGHQDVAATNWLERLKLYLAPLRRDSGFEIWDDSKIVKGGIWRTEIEQALARATVVVFLVGPGFLASDFVNETELPTLISAARDKGVRLFILVTHYCAYSRSRLSGFQAFNDPARPLEAIPVADQNKVLNDLSMAVDDAVRHGKGTSSLYPQVVHTDVRRLMIQLRDSLNITQKAFVAQCVRRNDLVAEISERLRIRSKLEYEKFFFKYFPGLTPNEKFQFDQIRALTSGTLYPENRKMFQIMQEHPLVLDKLPALIPLRQHLVFWLNKYESVFVSTPGMCLLYTGVEDGVPFPEKIDSVIAGWIRNNGD